MVFHRMSTDTLGFIIGKGNALEQADKSVHCPVKNQAYALTLLKKQNKDHCGTHNKHENLLSHC